MGDYFFAWEALSAPCGGTSPKGGGKGDEGVTDRRVGALPLLAMTGRVGLGSPRGGAGTA